MNCCQCQGIEELFNQELVSRELTTYRAKWADQTTRILTGALKEGGLQGTSLLDIGGGVGAIQHELLNAGVQNATDVDASQAYLNAAQEEAQRRGIADRIHFQHGDFVNIAALVPPADIVTLDRVLCCYSEMESLVSLSAARVRKMYGLVYPRDVWWVKIGNGVMNLIFRLQKKPFRTFIHSTQAVEAIARENGLTRRFYRRTLVWQVVVYSR